MRRGWTSGLRLEPADRTVRWTERRLRDRRHFVERDGGDSVLQRLKDLDRRDRLEVAKLMSDVRDAVVVEHEPRPELLPGSCELGAGDPVAMNAFDLLEERRLRRGNRRAFGDRH